MNTNRRIRTGIALMFGLILFPALSAGIYSLLPKYYYSKATVEINETDPAVALRKVQTAMAPLGKSGDLHPVRQTDLYELGVWDRDPSVAAEKANMAARTLSDEEEARQKAATKATNDAHLSQAQMMQFAIQPRRLMVWEVAEPASQPGWPSEIPFFYMGLGLGMISFFNGAILLLVGLLSGFRIVRAQAAGA